MPYPQSNVPREVPSAFSPPPGLPQTPPRWDPYPRYIDESELAEVMRYRPNIIVLGPSQSIPPGTPNDTIILRRAT